MLAMNFQHSNDISVFRAEPSEPQGLICFQLNESPFGLLQNALTGARSMLVDRRLDTCDDPILDRIRESSVGCLKHVQETRSSFER